YTEYADATGDLRLLPEAMSAARRAADELAGSGVPLMHAEALLRVARLDLLAGRGTTAAEAAAAAERSFRRQRRPGWAATAAAVGAAALLAQGRLDMSGLRRARRAAGTLERLGLLGAAVDAHLVAGRGAELLGRDVWAVKSYGRAQAASAEGSVLLRLRGRVAAAREARLLGDSRKTLQACRSGLNDLAVHRAALASPELRALASGHGTELGALGLEALVNAGSPLRVFDWLERTRAAALLSVEPAWGEGIAEELAALRALPAEPGLAPDAGAEEAESRRAAIEARVRRLSWVREATPSTPGQRVLPAQLRSLLGDRVLVELGSLDGELLAVVVSARRARVVRLGPLAPVAAELEGLLFSLRSLTRPLPTAAARAVRALAESGLDALRAALLGPLHLAADAELVVVPVGVLQRAPWSALHPGPVAVAPSASFWARTCQAGPPPAGVALVAGPGLGSATAEVRALAELHAEAVVLEPPHSGVDAVADALRGAGLAHLACHGRVRADNPMFSALCLSAGSLTVHELELRALAPRRIVLAACDAGADTAYAGDEMLGFVSSMLARGTSGIVASVSLVPDAAALPLMCALHEELLSGSTMARALHAARARLDLDAPGSFVNWCVFTAFGGG
ncbi:CHAT domain-containing protein, partial [Motilibacter deserti]